MEEELKKLVISLKKVCDNVNNLIAEEFQIKKAFDECQDIDKTTSKEIFDIATRAIKKAKRPVFKIKEIMFWGSVLIHSRNEEEGIKTIFLVASMSNDYQIKWHLFWYITAFLFKYSHSVSEDCYQKSQAKLHELFKNISNYYTKPCAEKFVKTAIDKNRENKKIVLVTTLYFGQNHSPTKLLLEYAEVFKKRLGFDVTIVCASETPKKLFLPLIKEFLFRDLKYDELEKVTFNGEEYKFIHSAKEMPDKNSVLEMVTKIYAIEPAVVVCIAGSSLIADACRFFAKTVTIPTLANIPICESDFFVLHRTLREDEEKFLKEIGKNKNQLIQLEADFIPEKPQKQNFLRNVCAINENAFVVAIVSTRFASELSDEFLSMINRWCLQFSSLKVVFIGGFASYEKDISKYLELKKASTAVGYIEDIGSFYKICNVYLNPQRMGGGFGAISALNAGIPVLTLDYGDVGSLFLGNDTNLLFGSWEEIEKELEQLINNQEYYQKRCLEYKNFWSKKPTIENNATKILERVLRV